MNQEHYFLLNNIDEVDGRITRIISQSFQIKEQDISDDLEYQSIVNWDSLGHVTMLVNIEEEFNIVIKDTDIPKMLNVGQIKKIVKYYLGLESSMVTRASELKNNNKQVHRGLNGVKFDYSSITFIDGEKGVLKYRGIEIDDLVNNFLFEEISYLLLYGNLPNKKEIENFSNYLKTHRSLNNETIDLIARMKDAHPIDMLRTVVSFMAFEEIKDDGLSLISKIPTIITTYNSIRNDKPIVLPSNKYDHAENFIYMLSGEKPIKKYKDVVNKCWILQADHGSNASTFTSRVVASTQANTYNSVIAAISAFSGPLHGGAAEQVMVMIDEIGEVENVPSYIKKMINSNKNIMGFGHRVYKVEDPRAKHLYELARELSGIETKEIRILEKVVEEMEAYSKFGLNINVDFFMGIIYKLLGIPRDLITPLFIAGRISGWLAQIKEQKQNNILIRPSLEYVGK